MKLADLNRNLWLWLFHDGRAWTAHALAARVSRDADDVFWQLSGMARRGLVEKLAPAAGSRRLRYAVTGTCLVPNGMCVAEVQLTEPAEPAREPRDADLQTYPHAGAAYGPASIAN